MEVLGLRAGQWTLPHGRTGLLTATEHLDLVFLLSSVNVVGRGELLVALD